ncbi:MAG TPA: hypothetical protein PKW30_07090 [Campylobacterales bacterium]|nr:hypothetical protein [Campylobacterales bacterium]
MQKLIESIKAHDKTGSEIPLKSVMENGKKTAFIIVFNRNQTTKHFSKVWSAKLEKLSKGVIKVNKIIAFKSSIDEMFRHSFDSAVKNFFPEEKDERIFAVYGNCAKRLYNAAKLKTEDMVAVALFGEDRSLLFLHTEPFSDAAVKKLEAVI